jgi:hypothetical protein
VRELGKRFYHVITKCLGSVLAKSFALTVR